MTREIEFTEKQTIIGHVETHSGSVALLDGIIESELQLPSNAFVSVDVNLDKKRIPVIATRQGGRRYLLLDLDAAEDIQPLRIEKVDTEEPAETSEKEDDENQ